MQSRKTAHLFPLVLGDAVIFALVTLIGFASHDEMNSGFVRMLATFLPLCAAWAMVAPWLGVYNRVNTSSWRQLWRPVLAMLLAAPMAGWLRGAWLAEAIPPIFILVIGTFTSLGILIWRVSFWAIYRSRSAASLFTELKSQEKIDG